MGNMNLRYLSYLRYNEVVRVSIGEDTEYYNR